MTWDMIPGGDQRQEVGLALLLVLPAREAVASGVMPSVTDSLAANRDVTRQSNHRMKGTVRWDLVGPYRRSQAGGRELRTGT